MICDKRASLEAGWPNYLYLVVNVNVICLSTKHQRALGTRSKVSVRSRSNWNLEMLVFVEGGKPEYPEKKPQSRDENRQQTQPTYEVESGNRTRTTLVGGECSHHCAIPASLLLPTVADTFFRWHGIVMKEWAFCS